jgi:hypothetical protein
MKKNINTIEYYIAESDPYNHKIMGTTIKVFARRLSKGIDYAKRQANFSLARQWKATGDEVTARSGGVSVFESLKINGVEQYI